MSPLVQELLRKRGVIDAEQFLNPNYERDVHDPFLLTDMERAVVRIFSALRNNERIAIYADYDCDGIPGAAVLWDFFKKIGYKNVEVYIPHRDKEGYGMHTSALDTLQKNGVNLIITVDVGTVAVDPIAYAKTLGIDVIVTDHHEVKDVLPDCVAVLNPKRSPYPFPHLCGAGMAFKLVQALLLRGREQSLPEFVAINVGWEKWLLDLVAIATVADMVELTGENRALVHFGLTVLRKSPRKGVRALCEKLRIRQSQITEDDIGFSFAPRVNAASRMDNPELAFRLLTTDDEREAQVLADELDKLNNKRKGVVASIVKEARKRVAARYAPHERVVVLGDTDWKPSLMGLAANSIMGDRGGVVCMWGKDALGNLKGSCRSDGSMSVVDLCAQAGSAILEYGGHAASGGFSVSHEHVHTLPEVLAELGKQLPAQKSLNIEHDALVTLREVGNTLFADISRLAPYGIGNPKPILRVNRTKVVSVKPFGKDKNHVEVQCQCPDSGITMRAFQYFKKKEDFSCVPAERSVIDLVVTLERDTYRGGFALRAIDILDS
jgi:single-stranded-DNA-specific exonuclease